MATQSTTQTQNAVTEAANEKRKDVINDMDSRRVLSNVEEATQYLAASIENFHDFTSYPIAAPGVSTDEDGNIVFDPEVYTDDMRVMVAVLKERGDGPGKSTVKAIVVAPVPSLDAVLASNEARDWLINKVLDKELNHIAVRSLRTAESIEDAVESMPKTLTDYTTSNRESGGLLAAYEELWRPIKAAMAKLSRPWKLTALSKKELRRGMESSAYAAEYYPTLEETKQGSLFVFALNGFIQRAKKEGLDPTIFERWLTNRDEKVIDVAAEDEDEFSLEDLAAEFEGDEASTTPTEEVANEDQEPTEANTAPDADSDTGTDEAAAPTA